MGREAYGLILANGGYVSKQSAGIYSARAPSTWTDHSSNDLRQAIDAPPQYKLLEQDCEAEIEAYTVRHNRHGCDHAYLFARNTQGRVMASVPADHRATMQAIHNFDSPVGM